MGVVFWEIASRALPHEDANGNSQLIISWIKDGERDDIPEDCPKAYGQLINKSWEQEPKQRQSLEVTIQALKTLGITKGNRNNSKSSTITDTIKNDENVSYQGNLDSNFTK